MLKRLVALNCLLLILLVITPDSLAATPRAGSTPLA